METWKQIPVAPDYEISDWGNIRRTAVPKRNRVYTQPKGVVMPKGYVYVALRINGKSKTFQAHRLVMLAFHGPSDLQVNHKNGVKHDNRLENLEYVSAHANRAHAKHALDAYPKGEGHPNSKLTEADVIRILKLVDEKWSDGQISKAIGCTPANVWMIRNGKAWKHLSVQPRPANYKGRKSL